MESSSGEHKKKKGSGRAKDTLFRIASRNQIELIAIADNKSNLILGTCVVLISLLLAILGSGLHIQGSAVVTNHDMLIPLLVLLIFLLAAATFAILAAKPHIIKGSSSSVKSLLFFRNINTKTHEEYLLEMHGMLSDRSQVYDQLITDMYFNGVVLTMKYRMLNIAYLLFMVGLILSVLTFLVALFL